MVNKKGYFATHKRGLLPWVTNWYDPQNHIRYESNIRKIKTIDWIFCHPQGFKLINYGQHILTVFWMVPVAYLLWDRIRVLSVLVGILVVWNIYTFVKKWKLRSLFKNTTYYDIYMREERLDKVKGRFDI